MTDRKVKASRNCNAIVTYAFVRGCVHFLWAYVAASFFLIRPYRYMAVVELAKLVQAFRFCGSFTFKNALVAFGVWNGAGKARIARDTSFFSFAVDTVTRLIYRDNVMASIDKGRGEREETGCIQELGARVGLEFVPNAGPRARSYALDVWQKRKMHKVNGRTKRGVKQTKIRHWKMLREEGKSMQKRATVRTRQHALRNPVRRRDQLEAQNSRKADQHRGRERVEHTRGVAQRGTRRYWIQLKNMNIGKSEKRAEEFAERRHIQQRNRLMREADKVYQRAAAANRKQERFEQYLLEESLQRAEYERWRCAVEGSNECNMM